MDRYSRTAEVFKSKMARDQTHRVRVPEYLRDDPTYLPRLGWKATPRVPADWPALLQSIRVSGNAAFFCDCGVFDDSTPDELIEVLLAAPGRLVLTPNVWEELRPWVAKRPNHPIVKAVQDGEAAGFGFRNPPEIGAPGRTAFEYYVALLAVRHDTFDRMRRVFRREHNRDPDSGENRELAAILQKTLGARGFMLAKKPVGRLTDETLVYLAVEHALMTGRDTVVLTKDADVEEQFFKLLWLIDTHYRGMLLADRYAEVFSQFKLRPFPEQLLRTPAFPFEPENAVLIERDALIQDVLPDNPRFVLVQCVNVGTYFSSMAFGAEREMGRLLSIKDATDGMNTDRLGGRNLHASVSPVPVGGDRDFAVVAFDRLEVVQPSGPALRKLDIMQSISSGEITASIILSSPHSGVPLLGSSRQAPHQRMPSLRGIGEVRLR